MKIAKVSTLIACAAVMWSASALSAIDAKTGTITRFLTDNTNFGYCMVYAPDIEPTNDCRPNWFSIDCKGSFNSKETSRLMWDQAQLAYAMESRVVLYINDLKKHNDYCVVDRIWVVK